MARTLSRPPRSARLALVPTAETPTARASAPRQTLLSVVGTAIFNLYSSAIGVFGGPPLLPRGSTVTVRSSSVTIDCGDGYEVPADWYVPEGPTPTGLVYLQHGFLAAGPFYSYTASRLAEATDSIVVTTSLTSNFLACDGCWVGGSPMHKAVADLFLDGNTALADSALAAGYSATLLNGVEKVVLIGHSAGGGLAAGAAGYMTENGTIGRLAGVVMLDGVGFGNVTPEALAKLPDDVAIYNLSGKSYFWNMNGASNTALEKERSGEFYGVRLVGGLHSDSMAGGNIFVQTGLYLVTGFSRPENVKAAEILSAAWIDDMFAGTAPTDGPLPESPYYGSAGQTAPDRHPARHGRGLRVTGPARAADTARQASSRSSGPSCSGSTSRRALPNPRAVRRKSPLFLHPTRFYLLTEGRKRANLLASMFARDEDASQRPSVLSCGALPIFEEYAVLRYCWTLRWLHPAHLTRLRHRGLCLSPAQ